MGMTQTQKPEEDPQGTFPNNLFVPPQDDVCLINNLPPELLSRIFEIGSADDGTEDEDDVEADFWENLSHHLDAQGADAKDGDIEMKEESGNEDEEGDEEGTEDEGESSTGSSDFRPWVPFQIIVSSVCRHWRNVALSTPSLWTTIMVSPAARPPYERVSTMLERSKGLPIDIYVKCTPDEDECDTDVELPSDADLKFLFAMLTSHIHRWRTMEVTVSEYHHMYIFLSAVSDPSLPAAPQLTTLELYHHEDTEEFDSFGYPSMSKHLALFGGSVPMLTRLILWGVHVDWNQPWIVSASNLTELELAFHTEDVRPSWAQFTSILRGTPALENLSLRQSGPSGDPPGWFIEPCLASPADLNAPVQLPRVTDLVLAFHSQARAIGLIKRFYLPALKNLVLDFDDGDYTDLVYALAGPATSLLATQEQPRSLLSRLDKLKIAGLPCRAECVGTLYSELQNLTLLNISMSYLSPVFLDILCTCTLSGQGDVWLPRLVTLYVSGASGNDLREVVRMRREAGVPLGSLYVEESSNVDNEDVDWLKKSVETFAFFEGSDDEDDIMDFDDLHEDIDEWSDED